MRKFDIVIVGGGLVGASLAFALRHTTMKIALLEAKMPSNNDPRLFALNYSSCQFLKNMGVWPSLEMHAAPIHQVHVSHQGHFGSVRLNRDEIELDSLGHVIPAYQIETVLNKKLSDLANVTVFRPSKLQSIQQENGEATLTVSTESGDVILQTPLVIGADGAESTVRAQSNIVTKLHDYQQSALVTRTTLHRPHEQIAYERFYSNGAVAMLPLTGLECATIWSADHATINRLQALSDEDFLQELQKQFGFRLGRLQQVSKRHTFPLRMVRAEKAVDGCILLLGNASHTLHPIAAQGFNLALYEVATLADIMLETLSRNETLTAANLHQVNERIESQQSASIGVSHRLSNIFTSRSMINSLMLQLGMIGLNIASPLKKMFIEKMVGRSGRVPRLLLNVETP